ncbi:MAG: 3,4-dihydroxy-2-butanone-4-phosphate synthase [Candidatus Hydrothermarchaeaceae archaeon]
MKIDNALLELRKGNIVLVYDEDGREEETDIVVAAEHATPAHIRTMRKDGGGLICAAVHPTMAEKLGLPFLVDIWSHSTGRYKVFEGLKANDIPYDEKSAFSITINHRKTFTGITDWDRSLTLKEFSRVAENTMNGYDPDDFGRNFRSPGHVTLLKATKGLLRKRKGHTELSVALMEMAELTPIAAICEMLGDDGGSLSRGEAEEYADNNGLVFLEGREIVEAYLNGWKRL